MKTWASSHPGGSSSHFDILPVPSLFLCPLQGCKVLSLLSRFLVYGTCIYPSWPQFSHFHCGVRIYVCVCVFAYTHTHTHSHFLRERKTGSCYVAQTGLKLAILLPQCCAHRHAPPCWLHNALCSGRSRHTISDKGLCLSDSPKEDWSSVWHPKHHSSLLLSLGRPACRNFIRPAPQHMVTGGKYALSPILCPPRQLTCEHPVS